MADSAEEKELRDPKKRDARVRRFLEANAIETFGDALDAAEKRPLESASREDKKNYAQYLSEAVAVLVANSLRDAFPELLPKANGEGQESRARTGKGIKKLDVNYSTPELGLGLGISIKTINFRDAASKRYTKNPTRLDNEFRAEAMDYHQRQPYAVLAALVFVPYAACLDGNPKSPKSSRSSLAQIVNVLRHRSRRQLPTDDAQLFEVIYVGMYQYEGKERGETVFFDVTERVPQFGPPPQNQLLGFEQVLGRIVGVYDQRNTVPPAWGAEASAEEVTPMSTLIQQDLLPPAPDDADESEPV